MHMKAHTSRRGTRKVAEFYPFHSRRDMDVAKRECDRVVRAALLNESLVKQPCEVCGRKKSEAHHDDYTKPLEVKWLCRFHHRKRDAELRESWLTEVRAAEQRGLPVAYAKRLAMKHKPPTELEDVFRAALLARNTPRHLLAHGCSLDLIRQATIAVADAMDVEQIPETVLARRMNVSRQMVNNSFGAGIRTLKTLAVMADVLGYEASVVLRKRESGSVA